MRIFDLRNEASLRVFHAFADAAREGSHNVRSSVEDIITDVRLHGDEAIIRLTNQFDGYDLDKSGWSPDNGLCARAFAALPLAQADALSLAAQRIEAFHRRQLPQDMAYRDEMDIQLGLRWNAVESAGLYIPGGRAVYPSSVLMNAIPARVAGVERLIMTTPISGDYISPLVLAAAHLCHIDEIYFIGGAQAIAAMAYGTGRIDAVDIITGPGNAYVAEAKRQLYGVVGIDMVAGPSEILVVADADNPPDWVAADLLSQAEHDIVAQSILITDKESFAQEVKQAIEAQLSMLSTEKTARRSLDEFGGIVLVDDLSDYAMVSALINRLAPEHLLLAIEDPESLFAQVRHAGSVFMGRYTPEAIGDYLAGPNHVLPTGRRARFSSGLSVMNFMKRTSFINCTQAALTKVGEAAALLADGEGLPAHASSIRLRLGGDRDK